MPHKILVFFSFPNHLLKAVSNNPNHNLLFLHRHFIVTGEAQPAMEEIRPNIQRFSVFAKCAAADIGIGLRPSVAFPCNKGIPAVNRLHMHGFPDRPSFRIVSGKNFQNLSRTALSMLSDIQGFLFPPVPVCTLLPV